MTNSGSEPGPFSSEFLTHLRHELRTPINHMMGYAELLLEDVAGAGETELAADLHKVHAAAAALLATVNSVFADPRETNDEPAAPPLVSHDLRTPLNTIIGYAEILMETAAENGREDLIPDIARISKAGAQMLTIVSTVIEPGLGGGDADVAAAAAVHAAETYSPPVFRETPVAGGRILVVDDDENNCDVLSRRLQRMGHEVVTAAEGQVGIELLRGGDFDLLLLDILMPRMNGLEVLAVLQADPVLRHVPVIVLSASDQLDSAVRAIEMGADDFMPKPSNPVLLRARIGASLEKKRMRDREMLYLEQIDQERARSDQLLRVILPDTVVDELKATDAVKPRRVENVAVVFCDIVGFTSYSDSHEPEEVVTYLQGLVEAMEEGAVRHRLQKIKTIGDAFMATAGLLEPVPNAVLNCLRWGLDVVDSIKRLPPGWECRVGIHAGPVVAGVLGRRQYLFDIFGDTVNIASRMESNGVAGRIALSAAAWKYVADQAHGETLGLVKVKGKGELEIVLFAGFNS